MKWSILFLFLLLFTAPVFAQNFSPMVEIFFITENAPPSPTINCTLVAQSQCWGNVSHIFPLREEDFFLTDDYNEQTYVPVANNMGQASGGFDFISSMQGAPAYAFGLYKVIISNETYKYFYLDFRDARFGNYSHYNPPTIGSDTDIWIKYLNNYDRFEYSTYGFGGPFFPITIGQKLNIWDIKQKGTPLTSYFPEYVPNSLGLYAPQPQTKAKLFWAPPPPEEMLPTKYRIWYAWELDEDPAQPEPEDYYWVADVSASSLDYMDLSNIDVNTNWDALFASYYYIQALNGTQSLYTSNIVKNLSVTDWTKTLKITNDNNHPRIAWAPFGQDNWGNYGYKIYRKVETIPPSRPPAQYQLIYTTNTIYEYILSYTDYNFTIGGNSLKASYYVVPFETDFVGPASNVVSSNVLLIKNATSEILQEYCMDQNYPNPFNPSTQITYSLKDAGLVKLKVYNILGSEVAELVNETKEEGYHSVEFNASNLPSGVYICTLQVNGFSASQKMLLLK